MAATLMSGQMHLQNTRQPEKFLTHITYLWPLSQCDCLDAISRNMTIERHLTYITRIWPLPSVSAQMQLQGT